jgi:hypothetical protein
MMALEWWKSALARTCVFQASLGQIYKVTLVYILAHNDVSPHNCVGFLFFWIWKSILVVASLAKIIRICIPSGFR